MLENSKFKPFSIGETTEEQKKYIWANFLSGSQIKNFINHFDKAFINKLEGKTEDIFAGKSKPELVNLKKALYRGTQREDHILHKANIEYGEMYLIDKDTFQSETYPLITTNIDGYKDDFDIIVEIKSSAIKNIDALINTTYKYQLLLYGVMYDSKEIVFIREKTEGYIEDDDKNNLKLELERRIIVVENNKELFEFFGK